jgi:hypothetical protein
VCVCVCAVSVCVCRECVFMKRLVVSVATRYWKIDLNN